MEHYVYTFMREPKRSPYKAMRRNKGNRKHHNATVLEASTSPKVMLTFECGKNQSISLNYEEGAALYAQLHAVYGRS